MGRCPDAGEDGGAGFFAAVTFGGDGLDGFAECVDARVGVFPGIEKRFGVEGADGTADFFEFEEAGAFGDEEADAELDGGDVFDERFGVEYAKEIEIGFERRPLREGDEGGMKREAEVAEFFDDVEKICARVAFVEVLENGVIEIFDGADDEEAAGLFEFGEVRFVFAQVLDFYGGVVGDVGKFCVKLFD